MLPFLSIIQKECSVLKANWRKPFSNKSTWNISPCIAPSRRFFQRIFPSFPIKYIWLSISWINISLRFVLWFVTKKGSVCASWSSVISNFLVKFPSFWKKVLLFTKLLIAIKEDWLAIFFFNSKNEKSVSNPPENSKLYIISWMFSTFSAKKNELLYWKRYLGCIFASKSSKKEVKSVFSSIWCINFPR